MRRNDEKTGPQTSIPDRARSWTASPPAGGAGSDTTPGQKIPTLSFSPVTAPAPALPKGGGALRGIGDTFQVSAVTGTGSLAVPVPLSPTRPGGLAPSLSLAYDSGAGNNVFGLGWNVGIPSIQRKTEKRIPTYDDAHDADVFVLAGAEDLVPAWVESTPGGALVPDAFEADGEAVRRYRPRIEGAFARIERRKRADGTVYFRTVTAGNETHVFGDTPETRIADPEDSRRVFAWLLSKSVDDRGNIVEYEYAAENLQHVPAKVPHEAARRAGRALFANKHPKRIRYGNTAPYDPALNAAPTYLFEVVFDYGEHDSEAPAPGPTPGLSWLCRQDPFSSGRAGFEMRTYRLCRRVLVFHHFPELGATPTLVRELELTYDENPYATRLAGAALRGYLRRDDGTYASEATPSTTFDYSIPTLDFTVRTLAPEALSDISTEALSAGAQWVDLDGEGLPGLLALQGGALYYKRNRGGGRFSAAARLETQPSLSALGDGLLQVRDIAATGERAMVTLTQPFSGYFLRTEEREWAPFRPFLAQPNIDFADPNVRFLDLNGDGIDDLVIARDESFVWYPSRGKEGFDAPRTFPRPRDGERGPALVFADGTGTVFLADMTGDGLVDFVRVTATRVSYWPNLGHGRFGVEIVMSNSPVLGSDEGFAPSRVQLTDLDGTGPADLVYAGADGLRIYFNQAGNRWSDAQQVRAFPTAAAGSTFAVVDLFGTGTACLVWRNTYSPVSDEPLHYIDLLGGKKPYLLRGADNHCGLQTRIAYAPSTKFYLEDQKARKPWVTRLPFVVHLVERVELYEAISKTRLVTTYRYHHGHYDGDEREFRGFGRVDQLDTESVADGWGQGIFTDKPPPQNGECLRPPVLTKTWFHTGAFRGRKRIEERYRTEYYSPGGAPDPRVLPDTEMPAGLSLTEKRHAFRAMKGLVLRTEVYALDGSAGEPHPYATTEQSYMIRRVQPERPGAGDTPVPAVFFVHGREAVESVYERDPNDPRVSHQLTLDVDPLGHVTRAVTIAYGRVGAGALPEQAKTWAAMAEHDVKHLTASAAGYRHGIPFESRLYELTGLGSTSPALLYTLDGIAAAVASISQPGSTVKKRLLGKVRHRYYDSANLPSPLTMGQADLLALPYESYSLAFNAEDVAAYQGRVTASMLAEGGYVELEPGAWWTRSGRNVPSPEKFYLPVAVVDPFGTSTTIVYDAHTLAATSVTDALGNTVQAALDYRLLAPKLVTDANGNRSAARFDALGRVVATAVMGKVGSNDGDTLDAPTTRFTYVTDAFSATGAPNHAKAEARETHGDPQTRWQVAYTYSDGLGRVAMMKVQAEPGLAPARDASGQLVRDNDGKLVYTQAGERWVGTGRTIFDNKGQPVKQYEPYFSSVPSFEDEDDLVQQGVTPILRYDPLGRLIRTDLPNGSYSRTEFDAWSQTAWDLNDTVGEGGNAWTAARAANASPPAGAEEQRARALALAHANTPTTSHVDALGRVFLVQARLDAATLVETRTALDVKGQALSLKDALGRTCAESTFAVGGQAIRFAHIDSGEGFAFADVMGAPLYAWDASGHRVRTELDVLRRPTHVWVKKGNDDEWLSQRIVYGEAAPDPETANLRGKALYHFDGAGLVVTDSYDFKVNLLSGKRRLAITYDAEPDWSALGSLTDPQDILDAADSLLEAETFTKSTTYDALNRPTSMTQPDSSVILPNYNEAGLLDGVDVKIRGASTVTTFVENIDYDSKGRRERIEYGNGTATAYDYDPLTYRLTRLKTTRASDSAVLQNLFYTYDPAGNIVAIADTAHQTVFFAGQQVTPSAEYEYDALYRLIKANGREHAGGIGDDQRDQNDLPLWNLPHANDAQALRRYEERYEYDLVGNILRMIHQAIGSAAGSWTRRYAYGSDPFPVPAQQPPPVPENNRLHSTSLPGDGVSGSCSATYTHDANGNMTAMPHLASIVYTHANQMRQADLGGGGTAYYTYDAGGERVRKVIQRLGTTHEERIYLGGWELYRKRQGASQDIVLERETLHLMDDARRVAMIETKTSDADAPLSTGVSRIRFQLTNHLGSALLELDGAGLVISYEEYHPYGTSAYRSTRSGVEVSEKRYRYTGKERDEETGFGYHSARYYAAWLGRWTTADPAGMVSTSSLYVYCHDNPVSWMDANGAEEIKPFDPQEGRWFVKWLLYDTSPGVGSAIKDAITSDKNLQVAQNVSVGVAVGAGTIATGGALYTASVGVGTGTLIAGALAGGGSASFSYGAQGLYDGRKFDPVEAGTQVAVGAAVGVAFAAAPKIGQWLGERAAVTPPKAPVPVTAKPPAATPKPTAGATKPPVAVSKSAQPAVNKAGVTPTPAEPVPPAAETSHEGRPIPASKGAPETKMAPADPAAALKPAPKTLRMPQAVGADVARVRVRHFTRVSTLEPIQTSNTLEPMDQGSVFAEKATGRVGSPRDVESRLGIKRGKGGAYIEFDAWPGEFTIVKNSETGSTEYVFKGKIDLTNRNATFKRNR